jgi:hypothetical protein
MIRDHENEEEKEKIKKNKNKKGGVKTFPFFGV